MEWKNTDPRHDIYKWKAIIIVKPGIYGKEACLGFVETDHGWFIKTKFEGYGFFDVDDNWDPSWFWIYAPER